MKGTADITDILMGAIHSLLPAGGLAFSYFIMGWGWVGCVLSVLLSFFAASLMLGAYIWRSQRKEEK